MEENEIVTSNEDVSNDVPTSIDYYSEQEILNRMGTIINNQNSMISIQNDIISKQKSVITLDSCIFFVLCIFLIYYLLRNMVIVRG